MRVTITALLTVVLLLGGVAKTFADKGSTKSVKPALRQLDLTRRHITSDFDQMFARRLIRILVPFSRTLYVNMAGHEIGLAVENARAFEAWLNRNYDHKLGKRPIQVIMIPTKQADLLWDVAKGLGDIAMGNVTITEARQKVLDFVPIAKDVVVQEVVVTGPRGRPVTSTDDLAGTSIYVRAASSYHESLKQLNTDLAQRGKPAIEIHLVPDALSDEDLLEMVDAGILAATVMDSWLAVMWAKVLPKIRINTQATVRESGTIGWGIRKNNPGLKAAVTAYLKRLSRKKIILRVKEYGSLVSKLNNPAKTTTWKRFKKLYPLFRKYGERYRFDPLMLAALAYKESTLNQAARSHVGAIGVMQVLPTTAKAMGFDKIDLVEANIHAGTKYLDHLITHYFSDAAFDELNRQLFALAAYNMGPGNISKMRKSARARASIPINGSTVLRS